MAKNKILWADDEIEHMKAHIKFLENKGYSIESVNNGLDALEKVENQDFDIVFLDENMPGLNGLETLEKIKNIKKHLPIVMITKNEEEQIMENAIGAQIADYLIKPVKPTQILLSVKKILDNIRIFSEKHSSSYMQSFRELGMRILDANSFTDWVSIYKELVNYSVDKSRGGDTPMKEILDSQFRDANQQFSQFIKKKYHSFVNGSEEAPTLSNNLFYRKIKPLLESEDTPIYFFLLDNLRYDHWKAIENEISQLFYIKEDDIYMSILPTTTQYCRNSIFSGMMPMEIEKRFPQFWSNDEDEGGKNNHEEEFIDDMLKRMQLDVKFEYRKILNSQQGKDLNQEIGNLKNNQLNVIVYNFVDTLSHARTDNKIMRELAEDETAYRNIVKSWFEHSPLLDTLRHLSQEKAKIIITTDHGSVRVNNPVKIVGEKTISTNLRYKTGKSLRYNPKEVLDSLEPYEFKLPKAHMSSRFIFALNNDFFVYPNNLNHYAKYYKDTFQHGGISMEEMLIPYIVLESK